MRRKRHIGCDTFLMGDSTSFESKKPILLNMFPEGTIRELSFKEVMQDLDKWELKGDIIIFLDKKFMSKSELQSLLKKATIREL